MPTLDEWAVCRPDAAAIRSEEGDRTFAELSANANRLARALLARGLCPGDAVAMVCTNRPEFAEVLYACQRAGLRLTPVNWHLTADEVAYIVGDCEAKAFVADGSIDAAGGAFASVDTCTDGLWVGTPIDGFESYDTALATASDEPPAATTPGGTMLYTSGTTGRPKGVYRPTPPPSATANASGYDVEGGDVHLCTGPLYHAAPLAFSLTIPLSFGATAVLMPRWDAEEALRLVTEHGITHTHMVPTMFHRLLALSADVRSRYDLSSLRHVLHGAAPCPVEDKRKLIEWLGPIVWEYYAATEGMGTLVDSATWLAHPGTVGRPFLPDLVTVGDEDGSPLPAGEVGLVYLRAPAATRFRYFKDDAKTASAFRGEYFTLGDVGYLDDNGYLYLTDRTANLIISGGVNIYPAEVDAVLLEHPAVGDAATIGVPDDEWGESVLAVIELDADWSPSAELAVALVDHCRSRLAHFKCPRAVDFVDALPRLDNGKLYKRRLRDEYRSRAPAHLTGQDPT